MATSWAEEGALADMKHRLDKLRVNQSRLKPEDEPRKKDTLKILQSKFGSPVYDPTSPLQKAYDRSCARAGRRKSIEFEDLYLKQGSGLLQFPGSSFANGGSSYSHPSKSRSGSGTARKHHPLVRNSSGPDYSSELSQLYGATSSSGSSSGSSSTNRVRKSSDPSSHFRRGGVGGGGGDISKSRSSSASEQKGGQCEAEGSSRGQGRHMGGILSMVLSEEEKKAIDRKLAGVGVEGEGEGGCAPQSVSTPRKKKISRAGSRS